MSICHFSYVFNSVAIFVTSTYPKLVLVKQQGQLSLSYSHFACLPILLEPKYAYDPNRLYYENLDNLRIVNQRS